MKTCSTGTVVLRTVGQPATLLATINLVMLIARRQ